MMVVMARNCRRLREAREKYGSTRMPLFDQISLGE